MYLFSFAEAVKSLSDTEMLAPAYFIVGGIASGEVSYYAPLHGSFQGTCNLWGQV